MSSFPWVEFAVLVLMGIFGTIAGLPYILEMGREQLEKSPVNLRDPKILIGGLVQGAITMAIAAGLGLLAANAVGLGTPILSGLLSGEGGTDLLLAALPLALVLGILAGLAIVLLDRVVFGPHLPESMKGVTHKIPLWKRMLAGFYGGIVEELLMRLALMSIVAWVLGLVWQGADGMAADGAIITAAFVAALIFGVGHLPAVKSLAPLTPILIVRTLLLNGLGGLVFAYLYWQYGLLAAMIAHFMADMMLHVVAPMFIAVESQTEDMTPVPQA